MMQRHDFDPIAFIFGVVFTGLGVLFMMDRLEVLGHAQWLWPGLLVLLGLAVLVGARGRGGARPARPAYESGSRIDPALEDDLLHSPVRTLDSEEFLDTSSLFTLGSRTRTREEAAPARPQEPAAPVPVEEGAVPAPPQETAAPARSEDAAARPEDTAVLPQAEPEADRTPSEAATELLPKVDRDADTQVLPPGPREKTDQPDA